MNLDSQRCGWIGNPNNVQDIFTLRGFPQAYESILRLPVIRNIRAQEQELIRRILDENLGLEDEVLEIGAGTGFYSFEIAKRCRQLTALERAPGMARILERRIASANTPNIHMVKCDFFAYWKENRFDVVAAIGVLDSVADWQSFLGRCISLARRRVIITVPQDSFWGRIFSIFGKMSRSPVRLYRSAELTDFLDGRSIEIYETGLRTRWTRGLTLVVVIETETANDSRSIR